MSTETANLGLTKPELDEQFKLSDWNGNSDKIDEFAGEVNTALAGKASAADLAAKQDALTFDTQTAKESENSITSGGIWQAIWDQILGVNTSKNLSQDVPEGGYDCNTLTDVGIYRVPSASVAQQIANLPIEAAGRLIVMNLGLANRYLHVYLVSGARFFMRSYISTGWQSWYEYAGTAVTPASTNAAASEVI